MRKLLTALTAAVVAMNAQAQQTFEEHAAIVTGQAASFDLCVDAFAKRNAHVNASPSEVATSALHECSVYHDRMLESVRQMVLDTFPPGTTPEQKALDDRLMTTTLQQYHAAALKQIDAAFARAVHSVVTARAE